MEHIINYGQLIEINKELIVNFCHANYYIL